MHIIESVFGDVTVVSCMGKMTLGEGDGLLRDKIDSLMIQGCRKVILDLAAVPYIDSLGLQETVRAFMTVHRQGGRLVWCNLTKRIQDLLAITKLLSVLENYESIDDALMSFAVARLEISCPVCRPLTWTRYLGGRYLLSCNECDVRFLPRVWSGMLAPLEANGARDPAPVLTAPVSDLWWFTYYENGYGHEGVHLTFGRPSMVAITGRLDLFSLDIVQMACESVPPPRRVLLDAIHVRVFSPVARARLHQLCASGDGSRAVILTTLGDRDRAISTLGNLEGAAQSVDVAIRRRAGS